MEEIIFIIKEDVEQGYLGNALGHSIFIEGDSIEELKIFAKEAVNCHFDDNEKRIIRLHFVQEVILAS